MKHIIIIFLLFSCSNKTDPDSSMIVYSGYTMIPIEDFYRKVTGYDSIQLIIRHGKLEGNFCYPNNLKDLKHSEHTDDLPYFYIKNRGGVFKGDTSAGMLGDPIDSECIEFPHRSGDSLWAKIGGT